MVASLAKRVEVLEKQLAQLQQKQGSPDPTSRAWLDDWYGKFAGDPIFAEAMRLGREYRKSLRPKSKTKRKR